MPARSVVGRRELLLAGGATLLAACGADPAERVAPRVTTEVELDADPFVLGVASGDPTPTSVVLWTRLAPDGGMPAVDVEVEWTVALDPALTDVVATGSTIASPTGAHSVHVDAGGLAPGRWYHYGFSLGRHRSPVGRTRTAPPFGAPTGRVRLGVSSCQNWEDGAYAAHDHAAGEPLDLFVWLGDYVYEGRSIGDPPRRHPEHEATTLQDYRDRYALYKQDPALRANHAARPWLVTWDDHEVQNDYAGSHAVGGDPPAAFLARRAAAYRAWWEHMPVRLPPPDGPNLAIHRTVAWGDLVAIHLLDTRQHRDDQPVDGRSGPLPELGGRELPGVRAVGPTASDPTHTMLGADQEAWLVGAVGRSDARWDALAQSVLMQGLDLGDGLTVTDTWDGYSANRAALLGRLATAGSRNLVVLTGDLHAGAVGTVRTDPFAPEAPVVATEIVAPAISSSFGEAAVRLVERVRPVNPQLRHFDARNGYCVCDVTPSTWTTTFLAVRDVSDHRSPVDVAARASTPSGRPEATVVETTRA